eukprot:8951321-Heterocapsa_arctica.AAC.1
MVMPPVGAPALQVQGMGFGPAVGGEGRYAEDLRELKGTSQSVKLSQTQGRGSSIKKAKEEMHEKMTMETSGGTKRKKKSRPGDDSS